MAWESKGIRQKCRRGSETFRLTTALLLALSLVPLAASTVAAQGISDYFSYSYTVQFSKSQVAQGETFYATAQASASCINTLPVTPTEASFTGRIVAISQASGTKVTLNPSYTMTLTPFPATAGQTAQVSEVVPLQFPSASQFGAYTIAGELIEAKIKAVGVWIPVTSMFPPSENLGLVTYVSGSPAGGGGGGSGGAPQETPPPTTGSSNGVTNVGTALGFGGKFTQEVNATGKDGMVTLTIPRDTIGLDILSQPLSTITVFESKDPPAPPPDSGMVGLVYDLGPGGATFDPPINVTFRYGDAQVPPGVAEKDLVLATWDVVNGKWLEPGSTVDPAANTVTARIRHFSMYTIIGHPRSASFALSHLVIAPPEVNTGDNANISVTITNTGDLTGNYPATLKVDNAAVATIDVTVAGGAAQNVTFTTSRNAAGNYTVSIGHLSGTLVVRAPAPRPTATATPTFTPAPSPAITPTVTPATTLAPVPTPKPPPVPTPTPAPAPATAVNWWLIGGIAAGVIILSLVISWAVRHPWE